VPVSEHTSARSERDDWDAHWDHYAIAAERNPAQAYRRGLALRLLERAGAPARLLDIGSGQGDFLVDAAGRWPQAALVGLEVSRRGNEIAQAKLPAASFELVDLSRDLVPCPRLANWATHALCSEVLEHVDEPVAFLRHARAYFAPGARLVVTVPGDSLRRTFNEAGLNIAMTFGAGFPFFNLYRLVVIARGERLVRDSTNWSERSSVAARAAMAAFRPLLTASLPRSPWGTQVVGVAYEPR
jgi:SAM-dependent methyltransferase